MSSVAVPCVPRVSEEEGWEEGHGEVMTQKLPGDMIQSHCHLLQEMLVLRSISDSVEEGENGFGGTIAVHHSTIWTMSSIAEALVTGNERFSKPWLTKEGSHSLLSPTPFQWGIKHVIISLTFRLSEPISWPQVPSHPFPSWAIQLYCWTCTFLDLSISNVLTWHSSVLPSKWQECPGSLLEDAFSSWVQLDVRLVFLGHLASLQGGWVNKTSWVFQYKQSVHLEFRGCGWARSTHPCHSACSSCPQMYPELHITWRWGWLNLCVPAVCPSRPSNAGSQGGAQEEHLHMGLTVGQQWEPLLGVHSLTTYHLLLGTVPHFPFHWEASVTA